MRSRSSWIARVAALVLAAAAVPVAAPMPDVMASTADLDFHDCAFDAGLGNGECQHFLRNPSAVTDDPCWCDKCRNGITGQRHDGRTIPPDWNPTLFEVGGMDVYLKRHSVAWGITCSDCYGNDKPWPDGGASNIGTVPETDFAGRPAKVTVTERHAKELALFKKPPDELIVAYNRHFYVVTDIDPLKVRTPGGSSRLASTHEWAHLMIERAEFARREWDRNLGPALISKPLAIFAMERQRDVERFNAAYFGGVNTSALNGSGDHVCGGFCNSGQSMSHGKLGDDHTMQLHMRHMLAHNLLTCWGSREVRPHSLPIWISEGLAQWLSRTLPRFRDEATYCMGEAASSTSSAPSWSGKNWEDDVAKLASSGKLIAIEELMAKEEVGHFKEEDHKRSWSYCDLGLTEWREPFVKLLAALRNQQDAREAFTSSLGCTPEAFDARWRDRVRGKRRSMAPLPGDDESPDVAGASDRRALRTETNPPTLAAKLRALGEVTDKKTIPVILDLVAQNSDLVRETALVALLKTKDSDCVNTIWNYGLAHTDGIVRAYTAKLCARLAIEDAIPKLQAQLEDRNWYARAEAAVACATMKDVKSMAGMRKMAASDASQKAQVGAIDALAMFGEDADAAVPILVGPRGLDSSQWQVRIAAAQALGEIGSMQSVEGLITRMEKETGRVQDDIYEALKKIARDDLGRRPENWRKWWDREKANAPNGLPKRPPAPDEKKKPKFDPNDPRATHDGGPPPYFGVEIYSNRIAFVVDTTQTMLTLFTPDPAGAKSLSREYVGRDKLTICKEEVAQALGGLDPRAHFNIVAFGMQIRSFKANPVPASKGNIDDAASFLRSLSGAGRTNYFGALKAALDIGSDPDTNSDFKSTPDTITFLTDGLPDEGDIQDAETLVEWYTGLNRYARVKTHTITFGNIGIDRRLLRDLAERNGGRYVEVPELTRK